MRKKPMKPMKVSEAKKVVSSSATIIPTESECTCEEACISEGECICENEDTADTECAVEETCVIETNCEADAGYDANSDCTIDTEIIIQYQGKELTKELMVDVVKANWDEHEIKEDIQTMKLYFKPEDSKIYYVVNGVHTGSVDI